MYKFHLGLIFLFSLLLSGCAFKEPQKVKNINLDSISGDDPKLVQMVKDQISHSKHFQIVPYDTQEYIYIKVIDISKDYRHSSTTITSGKGHSYSQLASCDSLRDTQDKAKCYQTGGSKALVSYNSSHGYYLHTATMEVDLTIGKNSFTLISEDKWMTQKYDLDLPTYELYKDMMNKILDKIR